MNNSPNLNASAEPAAYFNLGSVYSLIIRKLWLIVLSFLVTLLLATVYLLTAIPRYESTAVLEVEKQQQLIYTPADKDGQPLNSSDDAELKTIEQALQLNRLFEQVVASPAVVSDRNFLPGLVSSNKPLTLQEIAQRLKKVTMVKLRHGTRLIDVSIDHPNPATAQLLTATLVNEFILQNGRSQTNMDKMAMEFLEGEASRFKTDLQKAQDGLQVYSEALLLKDQITDQQRIVDQLSQRYREKHPKLIQARSELAELKNRFDASIKTAISNSNTEATYWSENIKNYSDTSSEDRILNELQFVEGRTKVLQSEEDTQSALFDNVLKQMREADVSKEIAPIIIDVVQPAPLPDKPARPRKVLVLVLAALAGIVIGVGMIFVLNGLDTSLKTVDEIEQFLNLPVLGLLPLVKRPEAKQEGLPINSTDPGGLSFFRNIVLLDHIEGNAAESFRSLRASIDLLGKEKDHRVILFSSAIKDEGKTFTSSNYAVSLAQRGLKTLLIDADLRRPAIHQLFDISDNKMGLIEHVSLGVDFKEVIQTNIIQNLDILLRGVQSPNPAEFLSGDGIKDILQQALTKYDRIVLDSPPINVVSDTLLIAPHVQSICLVVRSKVTPRKAIQRALSLLEMTRIKPVGIVLNGVSHGVESWLFHT